MRTIFKILLVLLVAGTIYLLPHFIPISPIEPPPSGSPNVIITSEALSISPKLQQYVTDHSNTELYTVEDIYSSVIAPATEPGLYVSSINNVAVSGTQSSWARLYVLVQDSIQNDWWETVGYWMNSQYYMVRSFSGFKYVRLMPYGMLASTPVGSVTITYNMNQQITVNMDKLGQYYLWGSHYVTMSGTIGYTWNNPMKIYSFLWSKNPSGVMLVGSASKVPSFYWGWIMSDTGQVITALTDHPFSVKNIRANTNGLLRDIPLGRLPAETPSEVDVVLNKEATAKTAAVYGQSVIVRDLALGYNSEVNYITEALSTVSSTIVKVEDGTWSQAVSAINSGGDFIILGGHGNQFTIACCTPNIDASQVGSITFQTSSIVMSYGCSVADMKIDGNFAEKWLTSSVNKCHTFIGSNTFTDVPSIAYVSHYLIDHYRTIQEGKAIMEAFNQLESMYILRGNNVFNNLATTQRLAINVFGCPW